DDEEPDGCTRCSDLQKFLASLLAPLDLWLRRRLLAQPRRRWDQCWFSVDRFERVRCRAVLHERLNAEVNIAGRSLLGPRHLDLVGDLFGRPALAVNAIGRIAGPEVTPLNVLTGPPPKQLRIALLLLLDRPVELWRPIINPSFAQPQPSIGVQL